jgi:metallo-beta-lactamase family protein
MKISFHGACREVTGSCILVESEDVNFLIDCGMFQGMDSHAKNLSSFGFDPKAIDFVLLTHSHLDHCGRLPKLYKEGFRGRIYSTAPTKDLTELVLLDAARIAEEEQLDPLYTEKDIYPLMNFFTILKYGEERKINEKVRVVPRDAGHILGSVIYEVWVKDEGKEKKLVFSGDLGNSPAPIIRDPEVISGADALFIESTYGDRLHESRDDGKDILKKSIEDVVNKKGVLMIPILAIERAQEIIYELNSWAEKKEIPFVPMFLDSPLAIKATAIYEKYYDFFDEEAKGLVEKGDDLFDFDGLYFTRTREESNKAMEINPPKVIMAGSGMFDGGRINGYLKRYLGGSDNNLLIVSYQPPESLGRRLMEGDRFVEIEEKRIDVKANISSILSFSSHADQLQLVNWAEKINSPKPRKVFIVHGEEQAGISLSVLLGKIVPQTVVPSYGEKYEI